MPSLESINIVLNIIAIVSVAIVARWAWKAATRADVAATRAGDAVDNSLANRIALQALPQEISQIEAAFIAMADRTTSLIRTIEETSAKIAHSESLLKSNAELKALVQQLTAQNESLKGQIVQLNDMAAQLHSVYNSLSSQNERQAQTIKEQVRLIEELTKALDAKKIDELHQVLTITVTELKLLREKWEGSG